MSLVPLFVSLLSVGVRLELHVYDNSITRTHGPPLEIRTLNIQFLRLTPLPIRLKVDIFDTPADLLNLQAALPKLSIDNFLLCKEGIVSYRFIFHF